MKAARITADGLYRAALGGAAALVFVVVALIVFEAARGAGLSIRTFGFGFLTSTAWDPVSEKFGALPYIYGTVVSSALALILAVPLGIGSAVYLAEIAPRRVGAVVSFVIELLAAIPSIVYGVWGFFVLAPWLRTAIEPWLISHLGFLPLFRGYPFGIGMLNAAIVLSIMVLPTIVSISREVLLATPRSLREAALALGATPAEAIGVALGAARPGILGAVILALGRALGETMAVAMVLATTPTTTLNVIGTASPPTIAANIALNYKEATPERQSLLIATGLVLFVVTFLVNFAARWVAGRSGRRLNR